MPSPSERSFKAFPRGHVRDQILLAHFRAELRALVNPATGITFTEDEIQRSTGPGTRFYIEADAIDLLGQANQQRAIFTAGQLDPRRSSTSMLDAFHGRTWLGDNSRLGAVGAGGPAIATGLDGAVIPGSVTLGDPRAARATDPNGVPFQVLESATVANGQAAVTLVALEGGTSTRLPEGTTLHWSVNVPPGIDSTARTLSLFDGGFDQETDEDYSDRIVERIRERPSSGNAAHFQAWAREASVAVERVFVYPTAMQAGSVLVALTEKRAQVMDGLPEGPLARVPSLPTLNTVTTYLTPPASPVVPQRAFVLVTSVRPQTSDLVLRFSLAAGRSGGWADVSPWPTYSAQHPAPSIASVNGSGLVLTMLTDQPLPNGAASLSGSLINVMLWDASIARWAKLSVASITDPNPGSTITRAFTVALISEPELYDANGDVRATPVVHVGDKLSAYTDRAEIIAESIEAYFDSLGPGEIVATHDPRYARAQRQPPPSRTHPSRAGQGMISLLIEALGGTAADAELTSISRTTPDVPANIGDGPNMIVLGDVSVAPL